MEQQNVRIFVGFDPKEVVAYHVLVQSIIEKSSIPVEFSPIALSILAGFSPASATRCNPRSSPSRVS